MRAAADIDQDEPHDDGDRTVDIDGEMERIRFQGLAVVLLRHLGQGTRSPRVHDDREQQHAKRPRGRIDVHIVEHQAPHGFEDDPGAGQQQQGRFHKG